MPKRAHLVAGVIATLCIATFFLSTLLVELFGSRSENVTRLISVAQQAPWRIKAAVNSSTWFIAPTFANSASSCVD